MIFSSPL
jgi:hypothetical protein